MVIAALWLNGSTAWAAGSANLWPNGAAGNRANSEWRTGTYGGGVITRRTLLHVYAVANEYILAGSTARGVGAGDILVYSPGQVTGPIGAETVPAPASAAFSCNTQAAGGGAPANQGMILNRAAELAGPDTIPIGSVPGGYVPCYFQAPTTGIYSVAITGPNGFLDNADGGVSADVGLAAAGDFSAGQGSSIAAWDVTVRSSLVSIVNIQGRVFTYSLALFTGGNGKPVFPVVYATTNDGYRYAINLRGMDPNGWVTYGNQVGFLDSDGATPLYHDAVALNLGSPGQLTNIAGGVQFAPPTFPIFFEPPSNATLTALGIPTAPVAPTISSVTFSGNVAGNTTTINSGGTFTYTSNVSGVYDIVISADGVNFDPTLPANRSLRGVRPAGTQTAPWDGLDNVGTAFPVGSYSFHASVHGGEYHFPFIDVENSTAGGPTITLLNPSAGCPPWNGGCTGAFYDDRAYKTLSGTVVDSGNTVGNTLCGLNPPATNHSDPLLGFDTSSAQRAFGANPGSNTNTPCTGSFGDAKGLDIWTYTPSNIPVNTVNIIAPSADIAVLKSVSSATPNVGSNVTFTVTATDNGPDPATGVAVTDLLPAGLTYVSSLPSVGSYVPGTGVWTIGNLANGASATLAIVATVTSTAAVTNTATKSGEVEADPNPGNNSASATVTGQSADIAVSKVVSNSTPNLGSNVTFTVSAINNGPSNATGVAVTDLLPAGLTFVSATPSAGSYSSVTGIWTIGNLANGASATLLIVATVNSTSLVTNTASKSAENEPDPNPANNSASAAVTGQAADIGVMKTVSNATPNLGSNVTFTVTATNSGPSNATGVAVTDILPAGLALVSSGVSVGSYNSLTGIWTIGNMANGATETILIVATITSTATITNTATKSAEDQTDPNPANNSASAAVTAQAADIGVTKTVSNATPNLGSNVTFTVTATNSGPNNATGVAVTDLLPAGLTYVSNLPSVGSYVPGTGMWTIGNLANGATATLAIVATVTSTAAVTNTASKSAENEPDPNPGNNSASATVTGQSADIAVTKIVSNSTPNLGSNVTFTVSATNNGPSNATGVAVTDLLPAGLMFFSATPSAGSYSSVTGIWTIGNLANGATATIAIVATVNSTGLVTNTASKSAENEPDPNPANNSASATVAGQSADIAVTKVVSNSTPNLGSNVTFTVSATNNGPSNATGVAVTDILPAGLTLVSSSVSVGSYSSLTGIWTIGSMANGATETILIVATVNSTATITNTAIKSAEDQTDPNLGNNSASAAVTGQAADIGVTKTVSNATPNLGSNVTFTVTATNSGPSNATGVAVTDLLPAGLTLVSATPSVGSYNSLTGVWTIGNLANGASATLAIVATVTSTAAVTNTATRSAEDQTDPNPGNNSAAVTVGAVSADISITKVVDRPLPNLGSNVAYTVTATNLGPANATGVAVTDQLPAGLTLVSSVPSAGSYNPVTGVWAIGNLANGANATLQIIATVNTTSAITNTASRSAGNQPDPNGANDASTATVTGQSADLGVTKSVTSTTPAVGTNVTFTVVITNHGPSAATGVQLSDRLPAGLTFVSASPSQGTYDPVTGLWTVGSLANSASATMLVVATVTGTTPVINRAVRAAGSPADAVLANDSAGVQVAGSTDPGLPNDGVPPVTSLLPLVIAGLMFGAGLVLLRWRSRSRSR